MAIFEPLPLLNPITISQIGAVADNEKTVKP
ncbi:hypothetical protein Hjap01_03293 [Haloarcula japonica]